MQNNISRFEPIEKSDRDYRAKRITAYLDLMQDILTQQFEELKKLPFEPESDITKYFEMLPETSELKKRYDAMLVESDTLKQTSMQQDLRQHMVCGDIDVNIMTKLDRDNIDQDNNPLPHGFSDALSALRGFANSKLNSSIVFSAGFNRRLVCLL